MDAISVSSGLSLKLILDLNKMYRFYSSLLMLLFFHGVRGDTHVVYRANLNHDKSGAIQDFGRCISGSKNGEEVVQSEAEHDPHFKCHPEASSMDSELVVCNQIHSTEDECQLCNTLKQICDHTYYGKWSVKFGSDQLCVECNN